MPLMDCDAPAAPVPVLGGTDYIDRLSFLWPNLIRFSRFSFTGGAVAVNPFTDPPVTGAQGAQKKAIAFAGGVDNAALITDRTPGAATVGHNGAAYNISFDAWIEGGISATVTGQWRDSVGGVLSSSSFGRTDIADASDDVTFNVTDTLQTFTWEGIASDDADFYAAAPNNVILSLVSAAGDIPSGATLYITNFQLQATDFYAPWPTQMPWRPAPGEEDLAQYAEYILSTNYDEMTFKPGQRLVANPSGGTGPVLAPSGPTRFLEIPETTYTLAAGDDGTLLIFTGADGCTVTAPAFADVTVQTKAEVYLRRATGAGPVVVEAGTGATLVGPPGCIFTLTSEEGDARLLKAAEDNWLWSELVGNPINVGGITIESQDAEPTRRDRDQGSLMAAADAPELYQALFLTPEIVQSNIKQTTTNDWDLVLADAPTEGNLLFAVASANRPDGVVPDVASGWTLIADYTATASEGSWTIAYKLMGSGESATQAAFTGGGSPQNTIHGMWELKNIDPDNPVLAHQSDWESVGTGLVMDIADYSTPMRKVMALVSMMGEHLNTSYPGAVLSSGWTQDETAQGGSTFNIPNMTMGHQLAVSAGATIGGDGTWANAMRGLNYVAVFLRPLLIWRPVSYLRTIRANGTDVEGAPLSLDVVDANGVLVATSDGEGAVTLTLNTDTDDTLSDDSDAKIPTQKAVKAYVDANVGGASALDDLSDVDTTGASDGDVLTYDSGDWVPQAPTGGGAAGGGYTYTNPSFSSVSALLHFDGTNGSTTITDQVGNTWTAAGSAAISTAQSVFGGSSLLVPGSGNSGISMPTNSGFNVGRGEWTIEFRWRYNGAPQTAARIFQTRNGDVVAGIGLNVDASGNLLLYLSSDGSSFNLANGVQLATLAQSGWNNVLVQRRIVTNNLGGSASPSVVEAFVNGVLKAWVPIAVFSSSGLYYNASDSVIIGGNVSSTSRSMNAYIDEFRFTKGVAAATMQYPPPSSAFPDS